MSEANAPAYPVPEEQGSGRVPQFTGMTKRQEAALRFAHAMLQASTITSVLAGKSLDFAVVAKTAWSMADDFWAAESGIELPTRRQ